MQRSPIHVDAIAILKEVPLYQSWRDAKLVVVFKWRLRMKWIVIKMHKKKIPASRLPILKNFDCGKFLGLLAVPRNRNPRSTALKRKER
jgi:hypothetical protein